MKNLEQILAEISNRAESATRAPWLADQGIIFEAAGIQRHISKIVPDGVENVAREQANGEFIAHARTDVPALIEALKLAIQQRDEYATLLEDETRETSNYRCDTGACDAELAALLKGKA